MNIFEYAECLKKYVNRDFRYQISEDMLIVQIDCEISYKYDRSSGIIYMKERSREEELLTIKELRYADFSFAMLMRRSFREIIYSEIDNSLETMEDLDAWIEKRADRKYFSVGHRDEGKISITEDNGYRVEFLFGDKTYMLEETDDKQFAFQRFFNEIVYYQDFLKKLKIYEPVFGESFTEEEIVRLCWERVSGNLTTEDQKKIVNVEGFKGFIISEENGNYKISWQQGICGVEVCYDISKENAEKAMKSEHDAYEVMIYAETGKWPPSEEEQLEMGKDFLRKFPHLLLKIPKNQELFEKEELEILLRKAKDEAL